LFWAFLLLGGIINKLKNSVLMDKISREPHFLCFLVGEEEGKEK